MATLLVEPVMSAVGVAVPPDEYLPEVAAIAPGKIATSILSPGTADIVPQLLLRRLGMPKEVAEMIYVLCSDQAAYITGAELHINGGQYV